MSSSIETEDKKMLSRIPIQSMHNKVAIFSLKLTTNSQERDNKWHFISILRLSDYSEIKIKSNIECNIDISSPLTSDVNDDC
jgi:hypothetical protein